MSGLAARRKGQAGERELFAILSEGLGIKVTRAVRQLKHDSDGYVLGVWSVEVKRRKDKKDVAAWWQQACVQAEKSKKLPVLAYRLDGKPWRFVFALKHIAVEFANQECSYYATVGTEEALLIIREGLLTYGDRNEA